MEWGGGAESRKCGISTPGPDLNPPPKREAPALNPGSSWERLAKGQQGMEKRRRKEKQHLLLEEKSLSFGIHGNGKGIQAQTSKAEAEMSQDDTIWGKITMKLTICR